MKRNVMLLKLFWEPIKSYKKGRICKECGHSLSIYNPNKYCWLCNPRKVIEDQDRIYSYIFRHESKK